MLTHFRANPATTHLTLMLALTFSTGVIDAVGYLGLDRVFTGNMTGNVVILAMALIGGDGLPILGPAIALAAFMAGAAAGGRVLRGAADAWTARHTALFGAVAGVILACAAPLVLMDEAPRPVAFAVTAGLGLAMGCQAATARHIAVKDVTTVVVTSTLTGLASDSVLGQGTGQPWRRRAGAVLLIGAGAAAGAALLHAHIGYGLALAAAVTLAVVIVGHLTHPARGVKVPYDGVITP